MKQVQPFDGFPPVDLGGEFVHGSNSILNKLAKENCWRIKPVSCIFVSFNNLKVQPVNHSTNYKMTGSGQTQRVFQKSYH